MARKSGVISQQLAQGDEAWTTHSGWWSTNHSLRVTEHEPLAQGDGARTTHSGWQSTNHSLRVTEHELLTLNDVVHQKRPQRVNSSLRMMWHGTAIDNGCSVRGLSTHASTPIKLLLRNGWPTCCCIPWRISLTLKPVFTMHAAVNEIKWLYPQNICSLMQNNSGDIAKFNRQWNKHCRKSVILPAHLCTCHVVHRFKIRANVKTFFFKVHLLPDLLWFPVGQSSKLPKI